MEKKELVLDTTVIVKWFSKEDYRKEAIKIRNLFFKKKINIIVSDLMYYEFANAIKFKKKELLSEVEKEQMISKIYDYNLDTVGHSERLLRNSLITASKDEKISIYDAIFFEIAKSENCKLITADDKFCKIINDSRVIFIGSKECKEYIESLEKN